MNIRSFLLAAFLVAASTASAQDTLSLTAAQVNSLYKTQSRSWVSVHDPSVVHATGNTYYIVGSHNGFARSTDNMVNWSGVSNNYYGRVNADGSISRCSFADAYSTHAVRRVTVLVDGKETEVDFGNFDAKAWANGDQANWDISGNMWAPDLIWNPHMKKWCMYMSVNGDGWHSLIVMLAADQITGPYVYQGPVHFSGFRNTTTPEINWKKTDLELVIGKQNTLPARYNRGNDWGTYWTNDIDPCVFFDEDGELWMTYGSWSGGIFIVKLDKQTGLRDYTVTYPIQNDGNGRALSDPYFGKRIAGGYYSSGEGSYIQHIGNYYYLFMSYGGFAPDGGYEMRVFRSATPDGKYVDASNLDACYHDRYWLNYGPKAQTNGGMKLMGAYNLWGFQTVGECAQGHNSAIVDARGRAFLIYHTKFNDGTAGHQVRTRQMLLNQQGWPCVAPFQFDGETENDDSISRRCLFTHEQIPGTYDVLIHKYRLDHEHMEEVTPIHLTLTPQGRITGDLNGSWSLIDGTGYIKVVAGGVTYNGVLLEQQVDGTTMKAICFTATSNAGVSIWGYKVRPEYAVSYTTQNYKIPVSANQLVNKNLALYGQGYFGARVEWESSVPEVISNTGQYMPADTATRVQLTCRIVAENVVYERRFNVTAQKAIYPAGDALSGLVAYYDFDQKPTVNRYAEDQSAFYSRLGNGTAPALVDDPARMGQMVQLAAGELKNASYVRFPNPLEGRTELDGFTVSAWVQRAQEDLWGCLWSFTDKNGALTTSVKQRLFLTGNGFLAFDDGENNFDLNRPNDAGTNPTTFIPVGEWSLVTLTVSKTDGIALYVDGVKKAHKTFASSAGTANSAAAAARLFDYQTVLDFVTTAGFMQLGTGGLWGSAEAGVDDLLVWDRVLTQTDVRALNTFANRVTDFGPSGLVGIGQVAEDAQRLGATRQTRGIFDLSGRRVSTLATLKGIYIINGRKVRF